jgi:hypothetical protein
MCMSSQLTTYTAANTNICLGQLDRLSGPDAATVCEINRQAALDHGKTSILSFVFPVANKYWPTQIGRSDLAQTWELAALITNPDLLQQSDYFIPWCHHPFGRLARNLMEQYRTAGDIQTVALLSCVFSFPGTTNAPCCVESLSGVIS